MEARIFQATVTFIVLDPKVTLYDLESNTIQHLSDFGEGQFWNTELGIPTVIAPSVDITEINTEINLKLLNGT